MERDCRVPTQWINRCSPLKEAKEDSRSRGGKGVGCEQCNVWVRFMEERIRGGVEKKSFVYEGGKGRCVQVWEQLNDLYDKAAQRVLTASEQQRASALVEEAMDLGLIQ